MISNRLANLKIWLIENKVDGFLVSNYFNIFYLSSFKGLAPEEREAWVLVLKDEVFLFTDKRYDNKIKMQNAKIKIIIYQEGKNVLDYLKEIFNEKNIRKVGFEAEDLRFYEYETIKQKLNIDLIPTFNLIKKQRAKKDKQERDYVKKACQIGDQCLEEIKKIIRPGLTEKEIAFKIEFWLKSKNYDLAFYPIVAVDENSSIPHYDTREGEGVIKENSVILIDFGVKYKNYCSDITRMFFLNPDQEKISIYQKLLKIQEETINYFSKAKPKKYQEVELYFRQLFKKEGFPFCPHSLGHGLGLEYHEYPKVSLKSDDKIEQNQIFTIEPGVYFKGEWGMRIEDTFIFDEELKKLTKFEKKINELILK